LLLVLFSLFISKTKLFFHHLFACFFFFLLYGRPLIWFCLDHIFGKFFDFIEFAFDIETEIRGEEGKRTKKRDFYFTLLPLCIHHYLIHSIIIFPRTKCIQKLIHKKKIFFFFIYRIIFIYADADSSSSSKTRTSFVVGDNNSHLPPFATIAS